MVKAKKIVPQQPAKKQPTNKQTMNVTGGARAFDPLRYMTEKELEEVDRQFNLALTGVDVVLFWTGVEFDHVQKWAVVWRVKTLKMAMGPLMDSQNPDSPKSVKKPKSYSRYIKGASGRFAQYACRHCRRVIVVTNPPPDRYSSRANNTYQSLEEPILKGLHGNTPISRIDYVHPTVDGAKYVTYQAWPQDCTHIWTTTYRDRMIKKWKQLSTSNNSLVGISQLNLPSLRTEQQTSPPTRSSELLANHVPDAVVLSTSHGSRIKLTSGLASDSCTARGEMCGEKIVNSVPTGTKVCIEDHESRYLDNRPGSECASSRQSNGQGHDQKEQEMDFHETGRLDQPYRPQPITYAIQRSRAPSTPTKVPIISIDDIAVGTEATVDVNGTDGNGVFLYLVMGTKTKLRYWKLEWKE